MKGSKSVFIQNLFCFVRWIQYTGFRIQTPSLILSNWFLESRTLFHNQLRRAYSLKDYLSGFFWNSMGAWFTRFPKFQDFVASNTESSLSNPKTFRAWLSWLFSPTRHQKDHFSYLHQVALFEKCFIWRAMHKEELLDDLMDSRYELWLSELW